MPSIGQKHSGVYFNFNEYTILFFFLVLVWRKHLEHAFLYLLIFSLNCPEDIVSLVASHSRVGNISSGRTMRVTVHLAGEIAWIFHTSRHANNYLS